MKYFSRSIVTTVILVLVAYLVLSLAAFGISVVYANRAQNQAQNIRGFVENQKYDRAFSEIFELDRSLRRASTFKTFSFWMRFVPVVKTEYIFYSELVNAGHEFSTALTNIIDELSKDNLSLELSLQSLNFSNFFSVFLNEHERILSALEDLNQAIAQADKLHIQILPEQQRAQIEELQQLLTQLKTELDKFGPFVEAIPELLGEEEQQEVLVLLQNPDELRPTGGFIGTLGRITVDQGEFKEITTDDVYSVDGQVLGREQAVPPAPIAQHTEVQHWYLRDANWDPDFPTSAAKVKELYEYESGDESIDTIVAVTPFAVEQFLDITGPVRVGGIEFNATNLIDALQYRVEQEFWQIGVSQEDRKEIVNDLAQVLKQRLFSLSPSQMGRLFSVINTALDQKEILLYSTNPSLQTAVYNAGYAGQIVDIGSDFLYVVDANLGALKTDRVMVRQRAHTLAQENGRWKASVNLTYTNNGEFDYRTTRYRTYVRLYVPIGSELVNVSGTMLTDRSTEPGQADITQEHNKTVFGAFISIEPGETRSLLIEYYLPDWLVQQFKNSGSYEMYFQKQPGVENQTLIGNWRFDQTVSSFSPSTTDYQLPLPNQTIFTEPIFGDNFYRVEFGS